MVLSLPPKSLMIGAAVAWSAIAAAAISGSRGPATEPAPVAKSAFADRFELPAETSLLKKQDRLAVPAEPALEQQVMQPRVIPMTPTPADNSLLTTETPEPAEVIRPEPPPHHYRHAYAMRHHYVGHRHYGGDVCSRHHMHKVWVNRRRWRCR